MLTEPLRFLGSELRHLALLPRMPGTVCNRRPCQTTPPFGFLPSIICPPWKRPRVKALVRKQPLRLSCLDTRPLQSLFASGVVTRALPWVGWGKGAIESALDAGARKCNLKKHRPVTSRGRGVDGGGRLNCAERERAQAGETSSGETSSEGQSPEESPEPPLPHVSLNLLCSETVTLATYAVGLSALSCACFPPLKLSRLPLAEAAFFHILLAAYAFNLVRKALQAFKEDTADLGGVLQPLVTVGLYWSKFVTLRWCAFALLGGKSQLGAGTVLFLSAAFFVLPQPLPFFILLLSRSRWSARLSGTLIARLESLLCVALLVSALPGLRLTFRVFHRAAKEGLPKCPLPSWDCESSRTLLIALFPALNWTLHPYALDWTSDRVALLPLPCRVPLPVPVPRWELLTSSWRALLYAAPMILPLARLLAAAAAAKPQGLSAGTNCTLVLCSRPVQMSAFVSVVELLLVRQGEACATALEQKMETEEAEIESLDKKLLEDFDRMLIDSLF
ncbi:hypothetical protein KFL_000100580 [Klebsormidium nitens]|uniref:Transmembrane protein n=1 Tax=Klebsormidium nitens TaxID=105231 RepID=A0A1Y1HK53_KLENI|nr:hypothetical protein KFL_000100580 [Klebsormidium nitens]|eukprot:GAQ78293.1 hypothetical protein KFL_000100580 [Klebsormidium nitens]